MPFRKEIRIRFGDIDHAGIVYYPTLVNYTHLAMEDFFDDHLGYPYATFLAEHRLGLPTVRLEMDFRKPLKYGDVIECESNVEKIGTTSLEWCHQFFLSRGDLAARARTVTVCTDLDALEKRPVPDWLRARIERAT